MIHRPFLDWILVSILFCLYQGNFKLQPSSGHVCQEKGAVTDERTYQRNLQLAALAAKTAQNSVRETATTMCTKCARITAA